MILAQMMVSRARRHTTRLQVVAIGLVLATTRLVGQTPIERDSAGIRIIENPARAAAPVVFRLGAPTLDLGGPADNPEDEFSARGFGIGGLRLRDGTIVVADVVRVLYFNAQGRRIGAVGRAGAGPAEFRSLALPELCFTRGDTLVAGDNRNGRFAVLHGQRVVRTTPYVHHGSTVRGCFDDGTLLLMRGQPGRQPVEFNRVRLDGTLVNSFGGFVFQAPNPVTQQVTASVRPRGQRVYIGDGATSEVRVHRADGQLTHIIRTADPVKRIPAADVGRALRGGRSVSRSEQRPETYPTYRSFHVDPEGRLWVEDFGVQRTDRISWTAFDINGRLVGRLEVPAIIANSPATVIAFGVNEVEIARRDSDGFVHLAFYPILRIQR